MYLCMDVYYQQRKCLYLQQFVNAYFAVKECHSRKKENALSFDKVEQMPLISGCLENDDLENDDLEKDDLENDDLKKPRGGGGLNRSG